MNDSIKQALQDVSGGDINTFVSNYRTALEDQYNANVSALENQRKLGQTGIMTGAVRTGLLHSSFPTIRKLRYDTETYEPALVKARQSYQTGLNDLYNNVSEYYNKIRKYQQQVADYNKYNAAA